MAMAAQKTQQLLKILLALDYLFTVFQCKYQLSFWEYQVISGELTSQYQKFDLSATKEAHFALIQI